MTVFFQWETESYLKKKLMDAHLVPLVEHFGLVNCLATSQNEKQTIGEADMQKTGNAQTFGTLSTSRRLLTK